ncbi:MAG: hypothetical protein ACREJ3_12415, partial [Polyangiaceae bacterium]
MSLREGRTSRRAASPGDVQSTRVPAAGNGLAAAATRAGARIVWAFSAVSPGALFAVGIAAGTILRSKASRLTSAMHREP